MNVKEFFIYLFWAVVLGGIAWFGALWFVNTFPLFFPILLGVGYWVLCILIFLALAIAAVLAITATVMTVRAIFSKESTID
jgi:hypothetical protein